MGSGVLAGGYVRGVSGARIPAVYAYAGRWLLVGSIALIAGICPSSCGQWRRIIPRDRGSLHGRLALLPRTLVHEIAFLVGGLPCWMGLGPILSLRDAG